jgi:hypothetical protein
MLARVYLRSRTGRSLLREPAPADPEPYRSSPETLARAARALERYGFTIEDRDVTLSVSGHPGLFEEASGTRIRATRGGGWVSSQPVMRIPELDHLIEGMVVAVPGVRY